jgi:hypothetical protein
VTETLLNPVAFAILLTSLYVLRFRAWRSPAVVMLYFGFFVTLEIVASHYFLPVGAFGPGLGYVCLGLTVPVMVAVYLIWRHEQRQAEGD